MNDTSMHEISPKKGQPKKAPKTSWGGVSDWYDEHLSEKDTYHEKVVLPNLLRLVDPKPGMSILDIACGQGFFAKHFLTKGASVTGVDIAPELIARAKKNAPSGTFYVSPSHKLSMIKDQSIDHAVITLAIQNIKEVGETFQEIARVLKSGGSLTIVMNHPAFRIPRVSSWGYDDEAGIQYRRLDTYLSESQTEIDMHPGQKDGPKTVSFHRPLQWYIKALTKHGLLIDRLEEWTSHKESVGKRAKAENKARKEFPLFLALRAVKFRG
jgi:ubiquinone/menaquinone biosynthesis C-methylase UbiE